MDSENNWDGLINEVKEEALKRMAKGKLDDEAEEISVLSEDFEFLDAHPDAQADSLESQLRDCLEFSGIFVQNNYEELEGKLKEKAAYNIYYSYGLALLFTINPVATWGQEDAKRAKFMYRHTISLCNKYRKEGLVKLFYVQDHNDFSDEEAHAELVYASCLAPMAILIILVDPSIQNLVAGAVRIKLAHQSFKLCNNILKHKKKWDNDFVQRNFESGVRLGMAAFSLGVAYLPSRYSKILHLAGFSGNKEKGVDHLRKAYELKDVVSYPAAAMAWVAYHVAVEYFLGLGDDNTALYEDFANEWKERAEGSLPVLAGLGALEHLKGNLDQAIQYYNRCINIQDKLLEVHYGAYLAIALCHVTEQKWDLALEFMAKVKGHKKWSPALITYCYAIILLVKMEEDKCFDQMDTISDLMKEVPTLKKHFGGRLAFHEKIVLDRAKAYNEGKRPLLLPIIELMYIWNYLYLVANCRERIQAFLERVENKIKEIGVTLESDPDTYAYLIFMKGVMHKHLKMPYEALECFQEALNCEGRLKTETQIPAQAAYETALIYRSEGQLHQAKTWLYKVKKYNDYSTQIMIEFRAEAALAAIKEEIRNKSKRR